MISNLFQVFVLSINVTHGSYYTIHIHFTLKKFVCHNFISAVLIGLGRNLLNLHVVHGILLGQFAMLTIFYPCLAHIIRVFFILVYLLIRRLHIIPHHHGTHQETRNLAGLEIETILINLIHPLTFCLLYS